MDKSDLITLLINDVKAWNRWRKDNPTIDPDRANSKIKAIDLSNANLVDADLSSINLSDVDLMDAALWDANLRGANFMRANLIGANLMGANLRYAIFLEANFGEANLRGADFAEAVLLEANFRNSNLRGAKNLTIDQLKRMASLYEAKLDTDLLEQVKQECPYLLQKTKDEESEK